MYVYIFINLYIYIYISTYVRAFVTTLKFTRSRFYLELHFAIFCHCCKNLAMLSLNPPLIWIYILPGPIPHPSTNFCYNHKSLNNPAKYQTDRRTQMKSWFITCIHHFPPLRHFGSCGALAARRSSLPLCHATSISIPSRSFVNLALPTSNSRMEYTECRTLAWVPWKLE